MGAEQTLIDIGAPASLPLGLVRVAAEDGPRVGLLGMTMQHPPVNLTVQAAPRLQVTGARANLAVQQAEQFLRFHRLPLRGDIKIELAIPDLVGFGSATMLGLSVARGLAWLNGLPLDDTLAHARALEIAPQHALETWGFDQGGLLVVGAPSASTARSSMPPVLRRYTLEHTQKRDWVVVFLLPKVPAETPPTLEAERLAALWRAAPGLGDEVLRLTEDVLLPAVAQDDLAGFAAALQQLQQLNEAALAQAGRLVPRTAAEENVLAIMQAHGALAWGRSPTGIGLFGLIEGASASVKLRSQLRQQLGFYAGNIRATITDNNGARHVLKPTRPGRTGPR